MNKEFYKSKLLSINEAAEYLGVKPNTIAVWLSTKRYPLKSVKLGRLRKFRQEDLDEFIAQAMEDTQNDCNLNKKGGFYV